MAPFPGEVSLSHMSSGFRCRRGEMARLRLSASLCILKIVHVGAYAEMVSNEVFQNLALTINVSHPHSCETPNFSVMSV